MGLVNFFEIGKITGTHGLNGELKVFPLTDNPERFKDLDFVYIEKDRTLRKHYIEGVKQTQKKIIVKLEGIDTVESAAVYKGAYLMIDRENAVTLPEGTYFICDIVGCSVYNEKEKLLGTVVDVLQTGSNDVYVLKDCDKREILVPALKSVVRYVSIHDRRITVRLPEGLLENEV